MNTMFGFHIALAFEIMAAVAATFLVVIAANQTGAIKTFATWVGSLGVLFSVTGMICTTYYGVSYWREGVYSPKSAASTQQREDANSVAIQAQPENALSGDLRGLFALSEAYPDLKANQNFLHLQQKLRATENPIGFARQH